MDNVIRLSKFVKNLGIVTTVLFLIMFYSFCIFRYCFNFCIQETNNCSK